MRQKKSKRTPHTHTHTHSLTGGLCDHCKVLFTEWVRVKESRTLRQDRLNATFSRRNIIQLMFPSPSLSAISFILSLYFHYIHSFFPSLITPLRLRVSTAAYLLSWKRLSFNPAAVSDRPPLNKLMVCSLTCQVSRYPARRGTKHRQGENSLVIDTGAGNWITFSHREMN